MDAIEFDRIVASAPAPGDRLAWFGALLAKESGTEIEIVGGSAIEIYLTAAIYTSQDVDLVGPKHSIAPILQNWRFRRVEGRSNRVYWFKKGIGLVDIVGEGDRSGIRPRRIETPYGPIQVSAVEPLIVRRLFRAHRENSEELYRQAAGLAKLGQLDWEYIESLTKYEGASELLKRLRKEVRA